MGLLNMTRIFYSLFILFFAVVIAESAHADCASDEYVSSDGRRCIKKIPEVHLRFCGHLACGVGFCSTDEPEYKRLLQIEKTRPEQCGLAKKEHEADKGVQERYDYSSSTSRALRNASGRLSAQMSRPNTEAIRRKEAWQREQAKKLADFRRRQAETKARREAMLAEARRLNAEYEACRKNNRTCSRGTRQ